MVDAATQAATDFFAMSPRCTTPAPAVFFDANTQKVTYFSPPRVVDAIAQGPDISAALFPGIVFVAPAPVALIALLAPVVHAVTKHVV